MSAMVHYLSAACVVVHTRLTVAHCSVASVWLSCTHPGESMCVAHDQLHDDIAMSSTRHLVHQLWWSTGRCPSGTLQQTATQCSTLQYTATHCLVAYFSKSLKRCSPFFCSQVAERPNVEPCKTKVRELS